MNPLIFAEKIGDSCFYWQLSTSVSPIRMAPLVRIKGLLCSNSFYTPGYKWHLYADNQRLQDISPIDHICTKVIYQNKRKEVVYLPSHIELKDIEP